MPRLTCRTWIRLVQYLLDLRLSIALNCVTVLRIFLGKYRGSKEGRVYRTCSADSQRTDWNSGRHLDDGQEGIKTLQGGRLHRNAENGQKRLGRGYAGEVGGTAGAGYDDLKAAALS